MQIFGYNIGEIGALFGVIGSILGAFSWIFKTIVVNPLTREIELLRQSINGFSAQMEESKQDRNALHIRINKLDKRVTVLEEHDKWEEKNNEK